MRIECSIAIDMLGSTPRVVIAMRTHVFLQPIILNLDATQCTSKSSFKNRLAFHVCLKCIVYYRTISHFLVPLEWPYNHSFLTMPGMTKQLHMKAAI